MRGKTTRNENTPKQVDLWAMETDTRQKPRLILSARKSLYIVATNAATKQAKQRNLKD